MSLSMFLIYNEWYSLERNRVKITVNILGESQEVIILKLKNYFYESENIALDIPNFQDGTPNTNESNDNQDNEQGSEEKTSYYLYGSLIAISILGGGYLYRKRIKKNDEEFAIGNDFSDVSEKFDKWE